MGPLSLQIDVDAPRERVFDYLCDLSRRPAWTDHFISELHLQRLDPVGQGAAARYRVGAPDGIRYMETVLVDVDRPHLIGERGRGGRWDRIPVRAAWELSGGEGSTTRVGLTFWTEPSHPIDRIRGIRGHGWWKRRWRKALRRLRDQLESPGSSGREPVGVGGGNRLPTGVP